MLKCQSDEANLCDTRAYRALLAAGRAFHRASRVAWPFSGKLLGFDLKTKWAPFCPAIPCDAHETIT